MSSFPTNPCDVAIGLADGGNPNHAVAVVAMMLLRPPIVGAMVTLIMRAMLWA